MNEEYLKKMWQQEEEIALIHGWDFSHIQGRYEEENDLPWNYEEVVREYLTSNMQLMDYDTGGGEFLLSLEHPYDKTSATEGYAPNVELCKDKLLPLGIDFKECQNPKDIPFDNDSFDIMINRHGAFAPTEIFRLLRKKGVFITEQVGGDNERDLVEMVLPGTEKPYPDLKLKIQQKKFEEAGFKILRAEEVFRPIYFYDVGAFVWFAHVIEWEFPDFSVNKCFKQLLKMQKEIDRNGFVQGTIHRYLIVATK